jgi:hypothetical protein
MVDKSGDTRRSPAALPGVTPLMVFYGAFAVAGAIVPWYFNIRHMRETGELLRPQAWVTGGFINALTGSITSATF